MSVPEKIHELVERFHNHIDEYKNKDYKEAVLCTDFLNPMFESLGWDVDNKAGYAERFRDVVQQYSQHSDTGGTKQPDYLFRIGGAPAFFLEAKKPAVDILNDKKPAYQLRRYGWNRKDIDVSVLSDFENLCLYDVRIQPKEIDHPYAARLVMYGYQDYIKKWDEIEGYLGRENVSKGSLDRMLKDFGHMVKGTREPVDESLLKMIEVWREKLAKNIALRNELDIHLLNSAVQKTIDRILFLRIAEDRGIEPIKTLQAATNGANVYNRLFDLFKKADIRYNSGLFHFSPEKGRPEEYDSFTAGLKIDDKILKEIVGNLYPPNYPFDFSVLPVDILGHVYEKFLGKVISLTDSHKAKVEEKPEVRKAGGVYYTPKYIVDYIVSNTVGKLVEDKKPEQVAKLKILDPACGSGSFLLGAYQFLLDWHLDWYMGNDPEKHAKKKNPPIFEVKNGWKLTTEKRKEILLNNIYGVDIDTQAVEVAKLNLLLKVLEQENTPGLFERTRRALPDLGKNIKCGNSLIENDFYDDHPDMICDIEASRKINAFDWDREFPEIIKWKDSTLPEPPLPPLKGGAELDSPPLRGGKGSEASQGGLRYLDKNYLDQRLKQFNFVYNGKHLPYRDDLKELARDLRKNQTKAEKKLWYEYLSKSEFKFKRQHPIDNFIVDFYSSKLGLVIEIDGDSHHEDEQYKLDAKRTYILENYGLKVIRFSNEQVLNEFEGVCEVIGNETLPDSLRESSLPEREGNSPFPQEGSEKPPSSRGEDLTKSNQGGSKVRQLEKGYGFDAVIGNPPYIRIQTIREWNPLSVDYYKENYKSAGKGNYDIYVVFVERGFEFLNKEGRLGYILPHKFFNSKYGESLREVVSLGNHLSNVVHFGDEQIFDGATTYTCLMFLDKKPVKNLDFTKVTNISEWRNSGIAETGLINSEKITSSEWNFVVGKGAKLFEKLDTMSVKLGDVSKIFVGLQTSADKVFVLNNIKKVNDKVVGFSKAIDSDVEIEKGILKKLHMGQDIGRFSSTSSKMIIYPYKIENGKPVLYSSDEIKDRFPKCWKYLNKCSQFLKDREGGKWNIEEWWQYGRNQNIAEMGTEKIILQVLSKYGSYDYDPDASCAIVGGGNAGGYGISLTKGGIGYLYLLGLLNSKVLNYFVRQVSTTFRGGFYSYAKRFIEKLPINTPKDKAKHDKMVLLVETMLELNKQLAQSQSAHDKKLIKRRIEDTDSKIDMLVYDLYDLTPEEIKIVEDSMRGS